MRPSGQHAAGSGASRQPVVCRSAQGSSNKLGSRRSAQRRPAGAEPSTHPAAHTAPRHSSQSTAQQPAAPAPAPVPAPAAAISSHFVKAEGASNILDLNEFRRGVGLCIYRSDGRVFAARRMDDPARSWQMPQGGIDPLENPMKAALRELHEETGITSCRIVASIDHWLEYTFPTKVRGHLDGPTWLRYRGQTQKWYLLEFTGDDSEIDLSCHGHPEFSEFSWVPLELLPNAVVDFKRGVYAQVARHFGPEIARRVTSYA